MSKNARQLAITEIIKNNYVETQSDLVRLLNEQGFKATQATVSRDINDMKLVKTTFEKDGEKRFCYKILSKSDETSDLSNDTRIAIIKEMMVGLESVNNFIIIKSKSGMANSVAALLDDIVFSDKLGTIAGDDTVLVIMRSDESARKYMEELKRFKTDA